MAPMMGLWAKMKAILRDWLHVAFPPPQPVKKPARQRRFYKPIRRSHELIRREKEMVERYLAGATTYDLAEQYGITHQRVSQILRPYGVIAQRAELLRQEAAFKERVRLKEREAKQRERELRLNEALELIRGGMSQRRAARATGVPFWAVDVACVRAGVKSRHGRWRDLSARAVIVREMRGATPPARWSDIAKRLTEEGDPIVGGSLRLWAVRNCPDLFPKAH